MSRLILLILVTLSCTAGEIQPGASLVELKRGAEAGDAKAQKLFADQFSSAARYAAAEYWYKAAAAQGEPSALCALGELYLSNRGTGTNQVKVNLVNAMTLQRLAAQQGFARSHLHVSEAYRAGLQLPKDMVQSYKHLLLGGADPRDATVKDMILMMSSEQIAEAERQAKAFKPVPFQEAFEDLVFQSVRVSGTMGEGREKVALINGSIVIPGKEISINIGGLPARVRCESIDRDAVIVSFGKTQRAIPLARRSDRTALAR